MLLAQLCYQCKLVSYDYSFVVCYFLQIIGARLVKVDLMRFMNVKRGRVCL